MCGIACVAGDSNSAKYCYEALSQLEYRGYDSAGIAGIIEREIEIFKKEGRVKNIQSFADEFKAELVISHTRWATHGKPSDINSHPHLSNDKKIAIVHNGIIENYKDIKKHCQSQGVVFASDTDSECISQLISIEQGNILEKVKAATSMLKGSYALGILSLEDNAIVACAKESPLYIAKTTNGNMVASDVICFNGIASEYYAVKQNEYVLITKDEIIVYTKDFEKKKVQYLSLDSLNINVDLAGNKYYMLKEIKEIPKVINKIASTTEQINSKVLKLFEGKKTIKIIGCGTAYHASMYGAKVLQDALRVPCDACVASEFIYANNIIDSKTLCIFVSQSGETADTLSAQKLCKQSGAKTLAITNVEYSALAKVCDEYLSVYAGREIAVASTKAYIAQILIFYLLAKKLKGESFDLKPLEKSAKQMIKIDEELVNYVTKENKIFYLGRQLDYVSALEAALKLKEITYKGAEGYAAGELKHGTIALIEDNTLVIVFATDEAIIDKTLSGLQEVKARGAKIVLVSYKKYKTKDADYFIEVPKLDKELSCILSILPLQLLAFKVCIKLNLNPDKPRNLAKSVTVE